MATQPTNDLLVWANTDVNLPNLAGPNKTEPSADLVAKGWDFKQKPSADEFNYILNNLGEWVEYLKTIVIKATPEATANTLALRDTDGSFKVKQLTSTAPNGITPLVVTSTTKVNNLNADLLDGMNPTSAQVPTTICSRDASGNFAANMITSNLTGDVTGNAGTATKWKTARTLTATGFATGTVTGIDGSGDISLALAMGSGFTNSKTANGYTYLPNGLILQWGWQAGGEDVVHTVTLPITYPNEILNLSTTARSPSVGGGNTDFAAHGDIVNTSTIKVAITSASGAYPGANGVFWTTIGY